MASNSQYTCKDLILLQKYKDDKYRSAMVDLIISRTKAAVIGAAIQGETVARSSINWALTQKEADEMASKETEVRQLLKEIFKDGSVQVDVVHMNYFITEYWELVVRVAWA
jgi:hypothetical protein